MEWQKFSATDYLLLILLVWLALLSFYLLRTVGYYRRIIKRTKDQSNGQGPQSNQIADVGQDLKELQLVQKQSFQKYALMRFNPYEDTGGDQSFVVAFLDGTNNGLVISSLHSRSGTRIYAKPVVGGKATTHQFSKEEKEVVEKAARRV